MPTGRTAGLLPLGLTIDDIRKGVSKLRNRVIGRVFHELGLIEVSDFEARVLE